MRFSPRIITVMLLAATSWSAFALVPTVTSAIATQTPNTGNYAVDVHGTNFVQSNPGTSVIYINSVAQATTYISSTELKTTLSYPKAVPVSEPLYVTQAGGTSGTSTLSLPVTKLPMTGLTSMGPLDLVDNYPFDQTMNELNADPGSWSGAVIAIGWNEIQPGSSSDQVFTNIETALTNIATYNTTYNAHVTAKLRVFGGPHTPAWVITAAGGVTLINGVNGQSQTYPEWWTTGYHTAWLNLQTVLAAQYDRDPRLQQVSITSCVSSDGEPFNYPRDSQSIKNLLGTTYSDTAENTCLSDAPQDYAAWQTTAIDYSFGIFYSIANATLSNPSVTQTSTQPLNIMYAYHNDYPASHSLNGDHGLEEGADIKEQANHDVFFGSTSQPASAGYGLQAEAPPITFQAFSSTPTPSWSGIVDFGFNSMHMTELEVFDSKRARYLNPATGKYFYGSGNYTQQNLIDWAACFNSGNGTCNK